MNKLIEEMEKYAVEYDIPIMQKEGLAFFQRLIIENHIKSILEIGSAIGYSAIQLARLDPDIHIVTIERDDERYMKAVENIERAINGKVFQLNPYVNLVPKNKLPNQSSKYPVKTSLLPCPTIYHFLLQI